MKKFSVAMAAVVGIALATPVSAQNVAGNNGIWWGGAAGGPSAFTMLNPLTTVYGRIGLSYSFVQNDNSANGPVPFNAFPFAPATGTIADSWGGDLAIGFRLMPAIRYDLSLNGMLNARASVSSPFLPVLPLGTARVSSVQLMNNLYLDLAPIFGGLGAFNVYLTGGVGIAFNTLENPLINGLGVNPLETGTTRTAFAWTAGAGVQYQIINNMILDLSYRYLDAGRARSALPPVLGQAMSIDVVAHQIHLGLVIPVDGLFRGY